MKFRLAAPPLFELVAKLRRSLLDAPGKDLTEHAPHCRTVSWLISIPREANGSSTIRRLGGYRKYSQTALQMISGG